MKRYKSILKENKKNISFTLELNTNEYGISNFIFYSNDKEIYNTQGYFTEEMNNIYRKLYKEIYKKLTSL